MRTCTIEGCTNKHYGHGYCQKHYSRWRNTGDPTKVRTGHRFSEIDPAQRLRQRSKQQGQCLVYTGGSPSRSGHRMMTYRGKDVGVHRVAWTLTHGPIPDGLVVCHRCDVPNCINIEHLFLGTMADNNADRDQKGRHTPLPGSKNGNASLSEYQVIEIRELLAQQVPQREIGRRYGVTQSTVWMIAAGRSWKHVERQAAL